MQIMNNISSNSKSNKTQKLFASCKTMFERKTYTGKTAVIHIPLF